jgi:hypothetical protein
MFTKVSSKDYPKYFIHESTLSYVSEKINNAIECEVPKFFRVQAENFRY